MGMESQILSGSISTATIILSGIFLMLFMGTILLLFFYFSKKKVIKKELEKKDMELLHQKELLQATLLVQEEERMRIARDLHDDISSKLNVVALNSHLLTTEGLNNNEITEITNNITRLVNKALENSRKIAHDLLPPVLEKFGLNAALEELCLEYNSSKTVTVEFESKCNFKGLDSTKQLHVFRIIQELINNSIRHGHATNIQISFWGDDLVACTYSDNGKGFDIKNVKTKKGLGMQNIESRIFFLDGSITTTSAIGKGTTTLFNFKCV